MLEIRKEMQGSGGIRLSMDILRLDENILQVKIISEIGKVLETAARPGSERSFDFDAHTNEHWGPWSIITIGLLGQFDTVLSETEYVTIGRKNCKAMLIPVSQLGAKVVIGLVLNRAIETNLINKKIRSLLHSTPQ